MHRNTHICILYTTSPFASSSSSSSQSNVVIDDVDDRTCNNRNADRIRNTITLFRSDKVRRTSSRRKRSPRRSASSRLACRRVRTYERANLVCRLNSNSDRRFFLGYISWNDSGVVVLCCLQVFLTLDERHRPIYELIETERDYCRYLVGDPSIYFILCIDRSIDHIMSPSSQTGPHVHTLRRAAATASRAQRGAHRRAVPQRPRTQAGLRSFCRSLSGVCDVVMY